MEKSVEGFTCRPWSNRGAGATWALSDAPGATASVAGPLQGRARIDARNCAPSRRLGVNWSNQLPENEDVSANRNHFNGFRV